MSLTAGVVAVQGDVPAHAGAVRRAGQRVGQEVDVREIRQSGAIGDCDCLLLPGGESTAIASLVHREGLAAEIRKHVASGKPVLATCAGLILLSRDSGDDRVQTLDVLDIAVERNAFGRQRESFEAPLSVAGLAEPFPGVFIRAPAIESVGEEVSVLAAWDGRIVAVRQGPVVGTAFHPELAADTRLHELALFDGQATREDAVAAGDDSTVS